MYDRINILGILSIILTINKNLVILFKVYKNFKNITIILQQK